MESRIRFVVDAAHCQRATDELSAILSQQERAFLSRFDFRVPAKALLQTARVIGILASICGLGLCAVRLYFDSSSWTARSNMLLLLFFVTCSLIFAYQPWLVRRTWEWSFRGADRRARRHAERLVRVASRMAPFEADYEFKSDVLTYARGKDNAWHKGWSRPLKRFQARGLAVQAASVTVIFRKRTSFLPSVVILHEDREWPASVMRDAGIAIEIRETPGDA
jgi:hypothetical protein